MTNGISVKIFDIDFHFEVEKLTYPPKSNHQNQLEICSNCVKNGIKCDQRVKIFINEVTQQTLPEAAIIWDYLLLWHLFWSKEL